eukprot:4815403-Alexandrium_andersonii.AAC.1
MVCGIKLACQKGLEYGRPVALLKTDIRKAFGSLDHAAVAKALLTKGCPGLVVTALLREMRHGYLRFKLPGYGTFSSEVKMRRGARQGACASPAIWALALDV